MITKTPFALSSHPSGSRYRITNAAGDFAEILEYGARVSRICVGGRDLCLRYETPEEYERDPFYLGAAVGRVANRIRRAAFPLNGETVRLQPNEGRNLLHSGAVNFSTALWTGEPAVEDAAEDTVRFRLKMEDDGFPGRLDAAVTYRWTEDNVLQILFEGNSDADTVFSPTNHTYFNLSGDPARPVDDHIVEIRSETYLPVDEENLPCGSAVPAGGTDFDFRVPREIGPGSYDHHFVCSGTPGTMRTLAEAYSPVSGIHMTCRSDLPGLQFYTGDYLTGSGVSQSADAKTGFVPRAGFCFEAQFAPDALNREGEAQPLLKAGETVCYKTEYRFGTV